jgi:two-component system OmpR family sensor kinase
MVAQLNDLLARLADAIETQKRFTADAAHELRTPLSALQLQLQVLERARTPDDQREALAQLKAGALRANRLVEQLLTLARIEPDSAHSPAAAVKLDRLAQKCVAEIEPLAAAKRMELRLGRIEPVEALGHEEMLRTLLDNLVENAIRYTPAGGQVSVDAYADDGVPMLAVTDNGPGIAPKEREHVFDRFYRVAGTSVPGSGLGLAIVKGIAGLHGARVELGDGERGAGLAVRVRFSGAVGTAAPATEL